jgi:uncharacterized Zn-finger protein
MADRGLTSMAATTSDPAGVPAADGGAKGLVELRAADLLAGGQTFCPNPRMTLWNQHPRVFIDVGATGEGRCPYCGTVYRLRAGESSAHGH